MLEPGGGPAAPRRCGRRPHPRQPRLRPPAGHVLRAAGGRRAARAGRDAAARRAGAALRRARGRRRLRPALPRARARPLRARASRPRAATRRCSAPRWTASGPTCSSGRAPARWSWPTPSSAGVWPATASATSASAASTSCPPSVFDGVDYVALGHLHRPQTLTPRAALQRLAAGLLLRRGRAAQAGLAGRPRRRRARRRPAGAAADAAPAERPHRHARRAARRPRPRARRGALRVRPPHRPGPAQPTRCARCSPFPALRAPGVGRQRRGAPTAAATRSGCAAAATSTSPGSSSQHVRGVAGERPRSATLLGRALAAADRDEAAR